LLKWLNQHAQKDRDWLNISKHQNINTDYADYSLFDKNKLKIKRTA